MENLKNQGVGLSMIVHDIGQMNKRKLEAITTMPQTPVPQIFPKAIQIFWCFEGLKGKVFGSEKRD